MTALERSIHDYLQFLRTRRRLAANTQEAYRSDLTDFARYAAGRGVNAPRQITRILLRGYLAWVKEEERVKAAATLARRVSSLRGWLRFSASVEGAEASVPSGLLAFGRNIKRTHFLPKALSREEAEKLIEFARRSIAKAKGRRSRLAAIRDWAALEILYSSGLRISELAALSSFSVNTEAGTLRILGKGGKERLVPIGENALEALDAYRREKEKIPSPSKNLSTSPYLFSNAQGTPLTRVLFEERIRRLGYAALGRRVTPHQLRHSFATHLLVAGLDLRSLQEMLGHKSLEATQVYTALTTANLEQVYKKTHPRA
ncbi:MAG: tyrosine-type recombinase/integrase [Elusimicrobia bacterium]|nr:tyrosine-type recombinase/integrase [Elusimicrobiota bacterium]